MSTSLEAIEPGFVVRDQIPLPLDDRPVQSRTRRADRYPIFVTRNADDTLRRLRELLDGAKVALVTDKTVMALHAGKLIDGLHEAGIDVQASALPPGEASKSLKQAVSLWNWLAQSSIARRDVLVTFGGGVINDTGGWVASGYMRGIPYINLPTTLLAQVDGALGGKVAVNHSVAKNLLGAFYQPSGVISNVDYLQTIEERHLRAGLAESIKKAVIASPDYWTFIDDR